MTTNHSNHMWAHGGLVPWQAQIVQASRADRAERRRLGIQVPVQLSAGLSRTLRSRDLNLRTGSLE